MSKYTMTLKQITKTINIFDFDYPIFREEFRKEFEQQFIDYFYLEEIAHETIGQFKQRLKLKLNMVMSYYNGLYMTQEMEQRILDNYDVIEVYTRNTNQKVNSSAKNLFKDAPKTKIDIDKFDVVSSLSKDENAANSEGKENWTRTMKGNIGVQTDSDAIVKYWGSLRKVSQELFENELSELFMGVY